METSETTETIPLERLLRSRFEEVSKTLHINEVVARKWADTLIARYTEPQRYYHTIEHIHAMLNCLSHTRELVADETTMKLAIFFHDWIYDPKGKDNELESIQQFRLFANEIDIPQPTVTVVEKYIERTITHTLPTENFNADLRLFLDFDLEVLSRDEAEYALYAKQIRDEYAHLSTSDYCAGRVKVLRSFLGRGRLYFSDRFFLDHESKARENLAREIAGLEETLAALS